MSYVGFRVKVSMQNGDLLQGVISYVDNQILKLKNVQTGDLSRGIVKELIVSAANIRDISVQGKEAESTTPPATPAATVQRPASRTPSSASVSSSSVSSAAASASGAYLHAAPPASVPAQPQHAAANVLLSPETLKKSRADYLGEHAAASLSPTLAHSGQQSRVFTTDTGVRVPAVAAKHQRQVWEWYAAEGGAWAYAQFLENAGRSLAQLALKFISASASASGSGRTRSLDSSRVIVLTGPGCKGAAGICAARHLSNHGVRVWVCRLRAYNLSDEVAQQWRMYQLTQGKEAHVGSLPVEPVDLIIDALVGCGLKGPLSPPCATLVQWANSNGAPIVALDVPTGVDSTTGLPTGDAIRPTATLTLGLPKPGLFKASEFLYLADVGVPAPLYARLCSQLGLQAYQTPFQEGFIARMHANHP